MARFLEKEKDVYPDISVNNSKSKKSSQLFFRKFDTNKNEYKRIYVNKESLGLASKIINSKYRLRLKKNLNNQIKLIKNFMKKFDPNIVDTTYDSYANDIQKLIKPIVPTKFDVFKEWQALKIPQDYMPEGLKTDTKKGHLVRSKSERIIANTLFFHGIEYKYEAPLRLKNGSVLRPDFTIMHPVTCKMLYWEHFGIFDDQNYANNTVSKIELYELNDIRLGENLIVTFETKDKFINDKYIEAIIKRYVLDNL